MKKQILGFALVATSILTLGVTSHAATEATSEVGVGFEKESNTTKPTEPGEARGSLSLQGVPTAFQFGNKHAVTNGVSSFPVLNTNAEDARELNVYDDRTEGTEKDNGWALSGKLSDLTSTKADTLAGRLEFKMSSLMAYKATTPESSAAPLEFPTDPYGTGTTATEATAKGIDFLAAKEGTLSDLVKLEMGGSAVELFGVKDGAGNYKGGLVTQLQNPELVVTGGAKEETNYTGKVTWTLATSYTGTPATGGDED